MSSRFVIFLLALFIVAAAKRKDSRDRVQSDGDFEERERKSEVPTTTPGRTAIGDAVVEKFVETLMASERYLKMIETVERKLNHLDATLHEKTNSILKYVSETLRVVKASPADSMEKALNGMKGDLDRLKQSVATRFTEHPTMRGPTDGKTRVRRRNFNPQNKDIPADDYNFIDPGDCKLARKKYYSQII